MEEADAFIISSTTLSFTSKLLLKSLNDNGSPLTNSIDSIADFILAFLESSCKLETVVIFLALLELIKIRTINVYQDESFGNILIKRRRDSE